MFLRVLSELLLAILLFPFAGHSGSPSFASHKQKSAMNQRLINSENSPSEIAAFFSAANEPRLLFLSGLIILLIATGLKSELARRPSWSHSAERPEGRGPLSAR